MERGIIFSGPMVRAILDGRKTQTRRVIKDQCLQSVPFEKLSSVMNSPPFYKNGEWLYELQTAVDDTEYIKLKCPYGKIGDRLYVRETWGRIYRGGVYSEDIIFRADRPDSRKLVGHWNSPYHLLKKDSRIWLEITNIRVERVQDISEKDAEAEGVEWLPVHPGNSTNYVRSFADLWDSINAKRGYGWEKNPWVWVIDFKAATKTTNMKKVRL